jgi:hypothetical protein
MVKAASDYFDFNTDGTNGLTISLKDKFRGVLRGKITLPAFDDRNRPINTVGNFSCQKENEDVVPTLFTHIYFKDQDIT